MLTEKIHSLYSDFICKRSYSRWLPELKRRETWPETVDRYFDFLTPYVKDSMLTDWNNAKLQVLNMQVMPSMRGLWSAGPAAAENNFAFYNCAYVAMNETRKFGEMLYVLMHGTGMGFSVERQYVGLLPVVPEEFCTEVTTHVVQDSKLGWKEAYDWVIASLYNGMIPKLDYSLVRPKGARLNTFGGRASGPKPLKALFDFTIRVFTNAKGRKLNSLEVHDVCCKIAECVVVGGVRRSACISFSNLSDQRMKHAKDGQFWVDNPQRSMSNNSIAYTEKPDGAMFMEEWLNLMRSGTGERGIANIEAIAAKAKKFGRPFPEHIRANPCFTGDMRLLTLEGYQTFEELENTEVNVVSYTGEISQGKVWCSGVKETINVSFWNKDYPVITCTPNHTFMLVDGTECEASDLKGKRVMPHHVIKDCFEREPFMAGFIQGDGCTGRLLSDEHNGLEINIGAKDLDVAKLINAQVDNKKWYSIEAKDIAIAYGLSSEPLPTRNLPAMFKEHNKAIEFLSGLYSANGSVIRNHRIAFKTTNKHLAKTLGVWLKELLDIDSYVTTNKAKKTLFSNGAYLCKESYDVNITQLTSVIKFAKEISFAQEYKRTHLKELIISKAPKVSNVTSGVITKVYDFSEPLHHWGVVEGVVVHNCFEALLHDDGLCNLTESIVRAEDTKESLKEKIRAAVLLGEIQSLLTYFPNVSPTWSENAINQRLLGVSLSGTCDNKLLNRVCDKTRELLAELKEYAHDCDREFSGALGIPPAKQITLTKPSGTVSQMVNCASGIHPRYSDYYIRRVRVNAKDPIAKYLISKGVPHNPEVGEEYDSCSTYVFDFPIKSPRGCVTRNQWTAIEQLEYWYMINKYWCDGNPSCTIYVSEDEWVEVGAWVYRNWKNVCGISFLPRDGSIYQLAPYEEISKEEYYQACKMYSKVSLDFDSELSQFELEDETQGSRELACAGGSCEI